MKHLHVNNGYPLVTSNECRRALGEWLTGAADSTTVGARAGDLLASALHNPRWAHELLELLDIPHEDDTPEIREIIDVDCDGRCEPD